MFICCACLCVDFAGSTWARGTHASSVAAHWQLQCMAGPALEPMVRRAPRHACIFGRAIWGLGALLYQSLLLYALEETDEAGQP